MSMGVSKNNPSSRKSEVKVLFALSSECEICKEQCQSGLQYLETMKKKHVGRGVVCKKKKS
jgi:hypothetical protein